MQQVGQKARTSKTPQEHEAGARSCRVTEVNTSSNRESGWQQRRSERDIFAEQRNGDQLRPKPCICPAQSVINNFASLIEKSIAKPWPLFTPPPLPPSLPHYRLIPLPHIDTLLWQSPALGCWEFIQLISQLHTSAEIPSWCMDCLQIDTLLAADSGSGRLWLHAMGHHQFPFDLKHGSQPLVSLSVDNGTMQQISIIVLIRFPLQRITEHIIKFQHNTAEI